MCVSSRSIMLDGCDCFNFSIVLPSDHRLLLRKTVPLSDLACETLTAMPMESATHRIFHTAMFAAGLSMTIGFTVT